MNASPASASDSPATSTIHIDAILVLLYPGTIPPRSVNDHFCFTYSAVVTCSTGRVLHIDVVLAAVNPRSTLLPHETSAHVVGTANMIGNRLTVTASSISPGPSAVLSPALADLLQPLVLFGGVVTGRNLAVANGTQSGLQVVDVTIQRTLDWPHAPITIRCKLDQANEHVQSLNHVEMDAVVIISGVLSGFDDGRLAVSIHDIGLEHDDGFVCTTPALAGTPGPFKSTLKSTCRWFANTVRRGLQTFDKKSPRARASEPNENTA